MYIFSLIFISTSRLLYVIKQNWFSRIWKKRATSLEEGQFILMLNMFSSGFKDLILIWWGKWCIELSRSFYLESTRINDGTLKYILIDLFAPKNDLQWEANVWHLFICSIKKYALKNAHNNAIRLRFIHIGCGLHIIQPMFSYAHQIYSSLSHRNFFPTSILFSVSQRILCKSVLTQRF